MKQKTYTFEISLPALPDGPIGRRALYALPIGLIAGGLGVGAWTVQQATGASLQQIGLGGAALAVTAAAFKLAQWWRQRRAAPSRPATWPPQQGANMQSFDAFTNQATSRLARLIIAQGIHCDAHPPVHGPFTLTYRLNLTRDLAGGLRTLRNLQPAMTQALRSSVRLQESPQGILIEVQLPEQLCWTPNAVKLARAARWPQIPLGVNQFNRPVLVDPEEHGVMAWIAPPRRGKTASIRSTLYLMKRAAPDLCFLVCAMPAKLESDWGAFGLADGCLGLVGDFEEMAAALQWAVEMMQTRALDYKLAVIVDDLTNLTAHVASIGEHIDELATAGAGLGVHLMLGTHTSGSKASMAGMRTMASATCRVLFKAADNSQGSRSSGQKNAETGLNQLSGFKGDGILLDNGTPARLATAYVNDGDVLQLPTARGPHARPWLSQSDHGRSQSAVIDRDPTVISRDRSQLDHSAVIGATTGSDHGSQRSQPVATPHAPAHVGDTRGAAGAGVIRDHEVGGRHRDRDPKAALLSTLPDCFPIAPARALTDEEAELVRYLADSGLFSDSALADIVYKQRNPKRLTWVREALASTAAETGEGEMTEALALAILDGSDIEHPRRSEALRFMSKNVTINGKGWNEKGPAKGSL